MKNSNTKGKTLKTIKKCRPLLLIICLFGIINTLYVGFTIPINLGASDGENDYIIEQITDNDFDDGYCSVFGTWGLPQIHNRQVMWSGGPLGDPLPFTDEWEVFLYDSNIGITTQITDNNYRDCNPQIHGGLGIWHGWDGHDDEIFLYDSNTGITTQLTNNDYEDWWGIVHDGLITWCSEYDGYDFEIFLYDSNTGVTTQITDDKVSDRFSSFHDGLITWMKGGGVDAEIFFYDYNTGVTTQITDNDHRNYFSQIHDGLITWCSQYDGDDFEIFLYDSNTGITTQITDDNYGDSYPQIHDGLMTWCGFDGNDVEIFLATPKEDITPPSISIQYQYGDGTDGNPGKWNVFAYDDESGINEDKVNILIDGEFAGDTLGDYDVPNTLGEHTIYVEIENNDGYLGSESDSITIIDDDVIAPVIDIQYIGSSFDDDSGYFEWNIFDIDSGISEINVTISYESTEGLDDYVMTLVGTETGTWNLPSNLGIYTIEISARDNDDDRTLIIDSLTTDLMKEQEILDDDVEPPDISNLIIIPDIFEVNISFTVVDYSGINEIKIFINDDTVIPISQNQIGNTYYYTLHNEWLFEKGYSAVIIEVSDADNDRPNDSLVSIISGTFNNVLWDMYEYVDWQIEELKNYIENALDFKWKRCLIHKLTKAQENLGEAFDLIQTNNITKGLCHDFIAKIYLRITEIKTELLNRKNWIPDETADYIITALHGIRNNIIILMGASTGSELAYEIGYLEVDLLNLKDYIEEELPYCVGRYLGRKIWCASMLLEIAIFKISEEGEIECLLRCARWKLEWTIHKIDWFLEKGKISEAQASYLKGEILEIITKIELLNN